MAKNKAPIRPGLIIARWFKKSILAKTFKNAGEWLRNATGINGPKIINGKMPLIDKNAWIIAKATGGAIAADVLMAAENTWRPYYQAKHPPQTRTSDAQIKSWLHRLWLNSTERRTALKNSGYCCEECAVKQTLAKDKEVKLDVHHKHGHVNWQKIFQAIREELLVPAEELSPLCSSCHDKKHPKTYTGEESK